MRITTRFKVIVLSLGLFAVLSGLVFNQYLITKQLETQMIYDTKVMRLDQKVWNQVEKVASKAATLQKVSPTPTISVKLSK